MQKITEEQIIKLAELQKIDSEIAKLELFLKKIPAQIASLDERLESVVSSIETQEKTVDELNKRYRTYESDVQINLGKIKKSQEKLRSVKTNKEYQSSLKEIDDIKAKNSEIEDEMLGFLDQIEAAERHLSEHHQHYSQTVEELNEEKETIEQDAEYRRQKLSELESSRRGVAEALEPALLDIFDRIKAKQADGVAIAEVKNAVCQGCNLNIPPQMYNELHQRNRLKNCPYCERIIYWQYHEERSE